MNVKALLTLVFTLFITAPAQAAVLPPYSYTNAEGRSVKLDFPQNSMTVVHFWATWCVPCIKELPTVNTLSKNLATSSAKQWRVIAVSMDDKQPVVSAFLKRHRIDALDANIDANLSAMRVWKVGGLPTTIILDDKGNELKRVVGDYDWTTFNPVTLDVQEPKPLY